MDKTLQVRVTQSTLDMIEEIKNLDEIKKWNPTTSDIIRVAIAYYWEDICELGCKP